MLLVVAAVLGSACGSGDDDSSAELRVVATTTQIGSIVEEVAGDAVDLTVLLPAGADAHHFELNPRILADVNAADLVLRHGMGLDDWLEDAIEGAGGGAEVVSVTTGITPRKDAGGADDPHVWHNPAYAKVMVDNVVAALSEADPENAATFRAGGDRYKAVLDETDAEVRAILDAIPEDDRKLVTNHDAFGYFLDHYGLELVAAVIPSSNKDAQVSAKELAELHDLIKAAGVKAIFAEEEVDPAIARELSRDTGVTIVEGLYADSLGEPGSGADTIHAMWLFNARKIAGALS